MVLGTFMTAFALMLMQQANILTGGTAGLSLLVHYATGISFGLVFFIINIPFYYLAYKRLGTAMVIKTFIAVAMLSIFTELHPHFINISKLDPLYATVSANVLIGIGLLILFRHRSSLGGFGILALYVQEYYKISAGKVQLAMDTCVLLASLIYVPLPLVLTSIIGVVILNLILTMNHKTDRYIAN